MTTEKLFGGDAEGLFCGSREAEGKAAGATGQGAVGGEEGTRGDDAAEELTVGCLENKQVTSELKAAYSVVKNR